MKSLFILASVMVVLVLAAPTKIEAQKRKAAKPKQTNSKYLSRGVAKTIITQNLQLPKDETENIPLHEEQSAGYVVLSIDAKYLPPKQGVMLRMEQEGFLNYVVKEKSASLEHHAWWDGGLGYAGPLSDTDPKSVEMRQKGYVHKFEFLGKYEHIGTLTEKGKAYLVAGNAFKVARTEFGTITGIAEGFSPNIAETEYTLVSTPTPFGAAVFGLQHVIVKRTATFRKYDDGWRIIR